jgi:hypothetical protein
VRLTRLVATFACAGLLGASQVGVAGATTARAPSDRFCSAFRDYFQASFGVSLAASFAEAFDDVDDRTDTGSSTPDEIRNSFYLVLSPKFEQVTKVMAASGPRVLRKTFRAQSKAFAVGVDLMRDLGVADEQLDAIADAPVDLESADLEQQTGDLGISKAELAEAAEEFGKQRDQIDVEDVGDAQRAAYTTAGSRCGAFPSSDIACETLVTPVEAAAILGVPAQRDEGCEYEGPEPDTGVTPAFGLDVYESAAAFETLTKNAQNQDVPGVGDAAVALEGYSVFSGIKTCGTTLVVRAGDRTIVVALCLPDEADVPIGTLTNLADQVLERVA